MAIGDVNSQARGSGARFNDGKVALELIPGIALEDCARVFDYGRRKYAAWNWAKGMAWMVPFGCLLRHLYAWARGEDNDPESGLPHLGHAMCNLVMLSTFARTYPEGDDRPKGLFTPQVESEHINPAVEVIPHEVAKLMQRDGLVPNCDGHGNTSAPPSFAEIAAAQMREYDATKDDDEGELIPLGDALDSLLRADREARLANVSDDPTYRAGGTSSDDEVGK